MDTYPGMLRMFGLQSFLGPDYVEDYDEKLEALSGEVEAAASSVESVVVDADTEVRRLDGDASEEKIDQRKVPKKSIEKKPVYYNDIPDKIKPPPSRYATDPKSESSYVSYNSQLKNGTRSSFAVIRTPQFVTSLPVSYGSIKSGSPSTHFARINDGTGTNAVPVDNSGRPPAAPTAVRYMIMSNDGNMKSTTWGPLLITTPDQSVTAAPVALAENPVNNQPMSPSQQPSGGYEAPPLPSTEDYYSLISGESIARPDFHVAEPIDPPSVAAVHNPYGYSVNTVPAGHAPVVLPFITKAAPVASYTVWEIPSTSLQNTVTVTPSYPSKDALVASFVLQPPVTVVPTPSFSAPSVSTVSTSTAQATIVVTSVSSSVSTKYGK